MAEEDSRLAYAVVTVFVTLTVYGYDRLSTEAREQVSAVVKDGYHRASTEGRIDEFEAQLDPLAAGIAAQLELLPDGGLGYEEVDDGYIRIGESLTMKTITSDSVRRAFASVCPLWPFC